MVSELQHRYSSSPGARARILSNRRSITYRISLYQTMKSQQPITTLDEASSPRCLEISTSAWALQQSWGTANPHRYELLYRVARRTRLRSVQASEVQHIEVEDGDGVLAMFAAVCKCVRNDATAVYSIQ